MSEFAIRDRLVASGFERDEAEAMVRELATHEDITRLEDKVDAVEKKVDAVEKKVDAVEAKVDALEKKVDAVEAKVDALEKKVDALEKKVDALAAMMKDFFKQRDTTNRWGFGILATIGLAIVALLFQLLR